MQEASMGERRAWSRPSIRARAPSGDQRAQTWETVAASPAFLSLATRILEAAAVGPEDEVVDLGAGTGLLTLLIAPDVAAVTAVDYSQAMLNRLEACGRDAGEENVSCVTADLRRLPLPDESATAVVSNYAFHHLDRLDKEWPSPRPDEFSGPEASSCSAT